jgi:hypothetical protein
MNQYYGRHNYISLTTAVTAYTDTSVAAPSNVGYSSVEQEVVKAIEVNHWPHEKNDQFVVITAPGSTYAGEMYSFCGYHDWKSSPFQGGYPYLAFGFVPYAGDEPYAKGCLSFDPERNPAHQTSKTAAHEYSEAVTDPYFGGWRTKENYEIADICASSDDWVANLGWVQGLWDNAQNTCSLAGATPPSFALTTEGVSNRTPEGATLQGTINPGGHATGYVFEVEQEISPGTFTAVKFISGKLGAGVNNVQLTGSVSGLERGHSFRYKLVGWQEGPPEPTHVMGQYVYFKTGPLVFAGQVKGVTGSGAELIGSIDPNGLDTNGYFEYDTKEYRLGEGPHGADIPIPPGLDIGNGSSFVQLAQKAEGLDPGTKYYFRVVAQNELGSVYSEQEWFTTKKVAPIVTTEPASYVNTLEPELNAKINPGGVDTHYHFEYDTREYREGEGAHGPQVPVPAGDIGAGGKSIPVSQALGSLERSQTYHYRVVASNELGTTYGADQSFTTLPPCKGAEEQCVWSAQATANPPSTSEYKLSGVSCPSSTLCVAVGRNTYKDNSFLDVWNGSEWKLGKEPLGGNAFAEEAKRISCPGVKYCIGVGATKEGGIQAWKFYPEGSYWIPIGKTPPTPTGGTGAKLTDVSCSSESACTAVGSYEESGVSKLLVERWNGKEWSLQSAPPPAEGSAIEAMLGVSCPSASFCMAVGRAAEKPFAESWNGSAWSIVSPPSPTSGRLLEVSCPSASACMAVGEKASQTLTESWNGSAWSVKESANAPEAEWNKLSGVSCPSASSCFAVGEYRHETLSGSPKTLAESWNGSAWTLQSSPTPTGANADPLQSVSCTSSIACTAVGRASPGTKGEVAVTLGERWE